MGQLTFNTFKYYDRTGDSMTPDGVNAYDTIASTVTEVAPNDDGVLRPGESNLTNDWTATSLTYLGLFDFGGRTFMVYQDSFNYFLGTVEMNVPEVEFPTNWDFTNINSGPGDTTLACFAQGTMIATPAGQRAVETLRIGDHLIAVDTSVASVKWIGMQTAHKLFSGPAMQPVRIRAGALGNGLPHTDLTVTADHGMIIDGLVINAAALVNGTSIDFVPMAELPDRVTYYHIETEAHDAILANGTPAETFVDAVTRANFDNHQEYLDLYGTERIIPEMDRLRISSQRLLPEAIKARLGIEASVTAAFIQRASAKPNSGHV